MSSIKFDEGAGEELSTGKGASAAAPALAGALKQHLAALGLSAPDQSVTYDASSRTVTIKGVAADEALKEKIILCCGNVRGVAQVDDQLSLAQDSPAYPPSTLYEVKPGDTLDKIAKAVYGEFNTETIFEANRPMLKDPAGIYPGQLLRIPPKA